MKRNCYEMETAECDMETDVAKTDNNARTSKKLRENENNLEKALNVMEFQDEPNVSGEFFNALRQYGEHSLVEREPNPEGYSLLNPEYVGKKGHQELTQLQSNFAEAANYTASNARNKIDMIGRQMKYLQDTLVKVLEDTKRDSDLHNAACNFIKKPGHTYHLYERPSSQKYFSMLSPEDWGGNCPHKFIGSWFLESDQSWIPADEMHQRYPGLNFLSGFYMKRKSIQ